MSKICFDEIGAMNVTFLCESGVEAGMAVGVTDDETVGACEEGERFCGVVIGTEGDCAAVQVRGFACVKCSDSNVEAGYAVLTADGEGGVKIADAEEDELGGEYLVISVDATAGTAMILL